MTYLFLNTSTPERIEFFFASERKIILYKSFPQKRSKRIDVLSEISKALKRIKATSQVIRGIGVVVGPGYFSHLRTGIAIANAWSFACNIPLIGIPTDQFFCNEAFAKKSILQLNMQKKGTLLVPQYGKEPTITKKTQE